MVPKPELNLEWLIGAYKDFPYKDKFFTPYFDLLAGGPGSEGTNPKRNECQSDKENLEGGTS